MQLAQATAWVDYVANVAPRPPISTAQRNVLSHFACDGRTEFIEPLTGYARHPFADLGCPHWPMFAQQWWKRLRDEGQLGQRRPWWPNSAIKLAVWASAGQPRRQPLGKEERAVAHAVASIPARFQNTGMVNTSYLVLPNHCGRSSPPGRRNLFFDVGCAGPKSGVMGGFSISTFTDMYAQACIAFDRIYAWELTWQDPASWWRGMPQHLRARVTFFNIGVEQEPSNNRSASLIHLLRETATPEDFVAIKLDIDHPSIELSIVRQIANDPSLAQLVDEIFCEYHFQFDHRTFLDFLWSGLTGAETVDDALSLMHKLRKRGVRAHFWV